MSEGGNKCGISAIKVLRNKSVPLDQTGEVTGGIFGHARPLRVGEVDVMDAESFAAGETKQHNYRKPESMNETTHV